MENYIYALGFFDGVHLGHQALLRECTALAEQHGCLGGVITFANHPDTLVFGKTPGLINTPADRDRLLTAWPGIERAVVLPFDEKMRDTPWRVFLDTMRSEEGAAGFVCGDDFRFGRRGEGTAQKLLNYCRELGIPSAVVPQQEVDGIRVSSTHIRELLEQGETVTANRFLGHPHLFTGSVVHGKQLGRTLGIPTANLVLPENLIVPRFGVYACLAEVDGKNYPAVTNVGTRPTVNGIGITVEPWLLDFEGDLYGSEISLRFYRFLRPERRFENLEELKAEVFRNADQTRAYFQTQM